MNNHTLLEVLHNSAKSMHDLNIIDGKTMRNFDQACLPEVQTLSPQEIKAIRIENKISQSVFAKLLNASNSTIQKWETGEKKPKGISLKLLNIIKQNGVAILYNYS
ncbi:helix-turn-helix domain-containing protein [Fangia hongkongensis]|uniref:helix-turn-helix domain-containing protein n=1 Tax=Fangia hongkongensis TaxID=270495 RepID=UPI0003649B90|nr:DNA-binding transcriptional regulator [Fangia hongkongensis]MBK2125247.1 DNA-binding transcriptional regulator [Fangia hongkongensis]